MRSNKRLTHEEFLEKLEGKFPEYRKYYEIVGDYKSTNKSIIVKDKYGECITTPSFLLSLHVPTVRSAVNKNKYITNKFREIHGNFYDYSKVNYINSRTKIIIICPIHGEFEQRPSNHYSRGCIKCSYKKRGESNSSATKEFIDKSNLIHNNKYSYKKVDYINSKKEVVITCKRCNKDFLQLPSSHLSGCGCKYCNSKERVINSRSSMKEFINKLIVKFPNYRDNYIILSEYHTRNTSMLVSNKYGLCKMAPSSLLMGAKPSLIAAINKHSYFLNALKEKNKAYSLGNLKVLGKWEGAAIPLLCEDKYGELMATPNTLLSGHVPSCKSAIDSNIYIVNVFKDSPKIKGRYNYENIKYRGANTKFSVTCEYGHEFKTSPVNHISGSGCPICDKLKRKGFWAHSVWTAFGESSNSFDSFKCYILKCWNKYEEFFKIGKTYKLIEERYPNKRTMPYNYKVIKVIIGEGTEISKLERVLQKLCKDFKYTPKIKFGGQTECYSNINNINL